MSNIVIKEDEFRSIIDDLDKEITNLEMEKRNSESSIRLL